MHDVYIGQSSNYQLWYRTELTQSQVCHCTSTSPSLYLSGVGAGSPILLELVHTSTAFIAGLIHKLVSPSYDGELHILKLGLIYSNLGHTDRLSVLVLLGTAQPLPKGLLRIVLIKSNSAWRVFYS